MRIVETIPALKPGPLLSAVQADEEGEQMRKAAMRGVPALDVK